MKKIKLTRSLYAIVDDADYEELSKHKWCAMKTKWGFYATRKSPKKNGKRHTIRMHRQILGLKHGDPRQGDHQNHNTLDNRRANLRICTNQENSMNQKSPPDTASQFKGVSWYYKKWIAGIKVNGVRKHLGSFVSEKDAALAYNKAAKKYFGEFACLNQI